MEALSIIHARGGTVRRSISCQILDIFWRWSQQDLQRLDVG